MKKKEVRQGMFVTYRERKRVKIVSDEVNWYCPGPGARSAQHDQARGVLVAYVGPDDKVLYQTREIYFVASLPSLQISSKSETGDNTAH